VSAKVFKSVVHNDAQPKRVNNFVPVKARPSVPAEKASPRFVDIFEQAQKSFAAKIEKKYAAASSKQRRVFRSILTLEKPTVKRS
jgi:hypothetical protein